MSEGDAPEIPPPEPDLGDGLNTQQRFFVREYLIDFNASAAAARAGYSEKTRAQIGYQLLHHPSVQVAVARALTEREKRVEMTSEWVLLRLREVAERSMEAAPVLDRRGKPIDGEWTFDSAGANRSLELIGKHMGMFVDRLKIDDPDKLLAQLLRTDPENLPAP